MNKLDIIPKDQIRGQSVIKAIMARFAEARGGHLEDIENKRIEGIVRQQADDNFRLKQEAEILYTELKKLPGSQANAKAEELRQYRPSLFEKLKDVAQADQKGLDYNDRLMLQLQVNNGQRAKFISSNLKAFKTNNEKNSYIQTLQKKGIISDKILEQLRYLIANENKR